MSIVENGRYIDLGEQLWLCSVLVKALLERNHRDRHCLLAERWCEIDFVIF